MKKFKAQAGSVSQAKNPWTLEEVEAWVRRELESMIARGEKVQAEFAREIASGNLGRAIAWGSGAVVDTEMMTYAMQILTSATRADQPMTLREAVEHARDDLTTMLLEGYGDTVPCSTGIFHNAVALARADAFRKMLRAVNGYFSMFRSLDEQAK